MKSPLTKEQRKTVQKARAVVLNGAESTVEMTEVIMDLLDIVDGLDRGYSTILKIKKELDL